MSKYDHRLKRLESKTGVKKEFEYWLVRSRKEEGKAFVEKQILDIRAGKIRGKMGSFYSPDRKNIIIITSIPRLDPRQLKEKKRPPVLEQERKDPRDMTDKELDREIADIQQELDNATIKGTA